MDKANIKLFNDDSNNVMLPTIQGQQTEEQSALVSEDITKDINDDTVKTLRVKEELDIEPENFVLDLTNLEQITASQKQVMVSLISSKGTVAIYMYKPKQGLVKLGNGEKYSLERTLPLIRYYVFNNELKIYKNFEKGKPVVEVDTKDITKLRLNL